MIQTSTMGAFDNETGGRSSALVAVRSSFMAIIMLSAILGNALVLLALANYRILRSKTTVFIVNLAVADLAVGLTGMPLVLGSSIADRWIAGEAYCTVNGITNMIFCVASMLTLAGIALDRYFAIVHPFRYPEFMSTRRVAVIVGWVWLEPLALGMLPVVTSWSNYKYFHNEYICTVDWGYSASFSCTVFAVGFFVPLAIMCFCYFHILMVARKHSRKIIAMEALGSSEWAVATRRARQLKRDAKAAFMLLILIGNFMACWLPHFVGILCLVFTRDECPFSDAVFTTTTWLAMANSGLNPVIYGLLDRRLRQAVGLILRCKMSQRLHSPTHLAITRQSQAMDTGRPREP